MRRSDVGERIRLASECMACTCEVAREWVDAAAEAKKLSAGSPARVEDLAAGPVAVLRYFHLLIQSLTDIDRIGKPRLPGVPSKAADGTICVPVFPAQGLFDPLVFLGLKAHVRMLPDVESIDNVQLAEQAPPDSVGDPAISLVLGAGNVSSIPATDAFSKIFQERKLVLLKMNPVNDYLGPIFERAFAPLISAGYLQIVYGGREVGSAAISHDLVDEVHVTGSIETHDSIVWGPPGAERDRRKADNAPLLSKPIYSELGNVSTWIVVPGRYTQSQLRFQAENIASSITNNCSFNCVATKVVLTWGRWPERERFLSMIEDCLASVPRRHAYYPGASERFGRFTGTEPDTGDDGSLPWTFLRDVNPEESPLFFDEESFVPVCVETSLDAESQEDFLRKATDFVNERVWGTLCVAMTVPNELRPGGKNGPLLQDCLGALQFGTIGINQWPGLAYATMSPPWGGFPGCPISDVQSGRGWVHNTYMLEGAEKTVLEGPLKLPTKPFWFPTYKNPEPVAWKLFELYRKRTILNLTRLLGRATLGSLGM